MTKATAKRSTTARIHKRAHPARKRHGVVNLTSFNERLRARFKRVAEAAKDDDEFVLYVSTALNGQTPAVTGWSVEHIADVKKKSDDDQYADT
jgi:hypothetical protein